MDRMLRRLEAMLIAVDKKGSYLVSGNGDVIEPDGGVLAIGSGGSFALAAARAMSRHTEMSAADIARSALQIAAEICIYTNGEIVLEEIRG
jgi:ATP-dependent HslUV protease subunit HslV